MFQSCVVLIKSLVLLFNLVVCNTAITCMCLALGNLSLLCFDTLISNRIESYSNNTDLEVEIWASALNIYSGKLQNRANILLLCSQ